MNKSVLTYLIVGLLVGIVVGYGGGFTVYQPQVTQLQTDLSETQSALSASQAEAESLQGKLTEAQNDITSLEAQLSDAEATIASVEAQLAQAESDYSTLSAMYNEFRSDIISLTDSLKKKLDLESEIIKMWVHYERGEVAEMTDTLFGLETYVDPVGDTELSTIWDELMAHFDAGEYAEADAALADLRERNSELVQSDLDHLNALLGDSENQTV